MARPLVFFKTAWAEHYDGRPNDVLRGSHRYLKEHDGKGAERWNFRPTSSGRYYGYAPHFGKSGATSLSIDRFGAAPDDEYVDGVDIAFIAPGPNGIALVGWYFDARLYRDMQERRNGRFFTVTSKRAVLLPSAKRTLLIKKRLTSAAVWYANDRPDIVADVRAFMAGKYVPPHSGAKGRPTRQPDHSQILAVERAAIAAVYAIFDGRGYEVKDRSSEKVGWDVDALRGKERLKIEVKGCSGTAISAELTPNEYHHSGKHATYRICIVTDALNAPKVHVFEPFDDGSWWNEDGDRKLVFEERTAARIRSAPVS
jgi:hypothetical protein